MKKTLLCVLMVFLMAGLAACGKREKAVTSEELVGGISLSDSDAMTVSVTADITTNQRFVWNLPASSGTAVPAAISGDFAVSISAEAESTGKACHISGNADLDTGRKVSVPFEEYISRNEGSYDIYTKASGSGENEPEARWNHIEKKAGKLFEIKADAGKMKELKLKETEKLYVVTGIFPLSNAQNFAPGISFSGWSASDLLSGLQVDMKKMNVNIAMSFDMDKRLKSVKMELPEETKAEIARVLKGSNKPEVHWIKSASMTMDFDFDSKPKVQIPSEVQNQASAGEVLGSKDLMSENNISAETSEEFAGLFHLDYGKLEDENKLLISNMLYYMSDNERIMAACRGWNSLPEPDRNALAAIAKEGYIKISVLAQFGANESDMNALIREIQFPDIN